MKTPIEYFYHWEKETPENVFLKQPFGNKWVTMTFAETANEARKLVTALNEMGLKKGDHIGILSKNCYHWIITDIAITMGGFISVPFYASLPKAQLNEVILKSDIKLLFIGKLDSWADKGEALPKTLKTITFPHYEGNAKVNIGESWNELVTNKQPFSENFIPKLEDTWTILFTSGTTGSPKGVMLPFKSIAAVFRDEERYNTLGIHKLKEHTFFSFLPLNHVAERLAIEGAAFFTGGSISFAESIDTFIKNLQDIQPTVFFAVPRIWSKFQMGVLDKLSQKKLNALLNTPFISNIIKKKLKKALGLSKAEIVLTGAALTPVHLKQWYRKIDINLREVFGATEACGAITVTPLGEISDIGVGKAIQGIDIKIDKKNGEVIYRSDQLMTGYYKEEEKTKEILQDGWYYSGDKGFIDEHKNLNIIGRVKDAFKTEKGIYITPNPIENSLSKNELIEQVCVAGLTSPQPIALINLSEIAEGINKKQIAENLTEQLKNTNQKLANHSKVECIVVTNELWTEENHILTPTLKVKRNKIDEIYMSKYKDWYNQKESIIWE
ncbi:MAG: AMP-binding protein [Flavobacteriales bacterium]|nr:AMP-binding protein [Flavobacteriales bacterium]